jgi:hypothetical protein
MGTLPEMQKQDKGKSPGGHRAYKLSSVLPEMQRGKFGECQTTKHIRYQRARR